MSTFLRGDRRQGDSNGRLQAGDGPGARLPEERLELGKRLLDRIEIWRIRRQEDQAGTRLLNGRPGGPHLMSGEIVQHDQVAHSEGGDEERLDIGAKGDADEVVLEINGTPFSAAYGTDRADTAETAAGEELCSDTDNGFGLLFNWNELGDGRHEVVALVDGVELSRTTVTVTTLGTPFLWEASGTCEATDFPSTGEHVTLVWQEARQNFVITDGSSPPTGSSAVTSEVTGFLENPAPSSFQSGIGTLSGWVCEADSVTLEIDGQT